MSDHNQRLLAVHVIERILRVVDGRLQIEGMHHTGAKLETVLAQH